MCDTVAIGFLIPESDMDLNGWDQNPYISGNTGEKKDRHLMQFNSRSCAQIKVKTPAEAWENMEVNQW